MDNLLLEWLVPSSIDGLAVTALVATAFVTATITAVLGVGGGVLLLAVIANFLPPVAIIPVHGLVQAGANGNRALMTRSHIDKPVLLNFLIGACIGALLASLIVIQLPVEIIQLSIALFVFYLTWGPKLQSQYLSGWRLKLAAAATTLISMFVGASGPLVAAFVKQVSDQRFVRVATFSACMASQHGLKLLVFSWLGFAFSDWLGLIAAMILSGYAGTWIGLHLLSKISNHVFDYAFKIVLSILAFRLLVEAILELIR
ncbi:MAG: sulfite exporter TauE/SafE family protein [Motiliproteus sp.]|nr:sulfite exporter TauE/SafE family protein [Motiliproteus sp.]MCW9051438.1 sulfite exporter TauE/SafE family protein [Motiliproteus sp.]